MAFGLGLHSQVTLSFAEQELFPEDWNLEDGALKITDNSFRIVAKICGKNATKGNPEKSIEAHQKMVGESVVLKITDNSSRNHAQMNATPCPYQVIL